MIKRKKFQRILCIRPDNMGDILMSTPAIRALKETFHAHITLLTSSNGAPIVPYIPGIDECIQLNLPWVGHSFIDSDIMAAALELRKGNYDLAVIFTVYSQSAFPSALLAFMAGIPQRVAYCRENPYRLLTNWIPDTEPLFTTGKHQVQRDLDLVKTIGATTSNMRLSILPPENLLQPLRNKLAWLGIDLSRPWCVLHPGTQDFKRKYPTHEWISIAGSLAENLNIQLLITGNEKDLSDAGQISSALKHDCYNLAGLLSLGELILLIRESFLLVSINSVPVHIAAAVQTPVVVLYAKTNPQHTPWQVASKVCLFNVPAHAKSNNIILRYLDATYQWEDAEASTEKILLFARSLLVSRSKSSVS